MDRYEALIEALGEIPFRRDVPMKELTTFRVGGPADLVVWPRSGEEALTALSAGEIYGVPAFVMGNGSDLLVRDGGIRGLVVCIGEAMAETTHDGCYWRAGAGRSLTGLARETVRAGFRGFEWAAGIPGTLGGACAMNAGAYGGEMKDVLREVTVIEDGALRTIPVMESDLGYRRSAFAAPGRIVVEALLLLSPDDGGAAERMADYTKRRQEKQPLTFPSAGSTFKRPPGHFAGQLIQEAGLKGYAVGGAQVSELHAGFVINRGGATAEDVLRVIAHVQDTVLKHSGVALECEVKIIGEG